MLQFVPDVEAADRDHEGRRGGRQGADHDAADQHGPKDQDEGAPASVQNAVSQADFPFGSPDLPVNRL